jgi:hypothetical protein
MPISSFEFEQMKARVSRGLSDGLAMEADDGQESELHQKIISECQTRRWYFIRSKMHKKSTINPGAADFTIFGQKFGAPFVYSVECKAKGKKQSQEQVIAMHSLKSTGHHYAVVYSFAEFLKEISQ